MRLTLALVALIFFLRNALLPLAADDFSYAFIWDGDHVGNILHGVSESIARVNSIGDLIQSQWSHYMTWGGRTPAHTLIQIFIWIGKIYFNVANTLMFIALIILIVRLAEVRLTTKNLLWIVLGMWIAVPEWISTMQWLTGACNYLWAGVAQLLFIYFIFRPPAPTLTGGSVGGAQKIFLALLGLLAGWSNEAGAAATFFIALCMIFRQKKIRAEQSLGLIFFLIGFALLIFAPGNFNRLQLSCPDFVLSTALIIDHIFIALQIIFAELILFVPIAILIFRRRPLGSIKIFVAAGLLVPTMMIFSPEFPLRSCFMSAIFLMIASTAAFDQINFDPRKFFVPLTVIGVMWTLSIVGSLYSDVSIYRQTQRRIELIDARQSDALIEVPPLNPTRRLEKFLGLRIFGSAAMSLGGDLSNDPRDGHNATFAKFYGVSAIAVER